MVLKKFSMLSSMFDLDERDETLGDTMLFDPTIHLRSFFLLDVTNLYIYEKENDCEPCCIIYFGKFKKRGCYLYKAGYSYLSSIYLDIESGYYPDKDIPNIIMDAYKRYLSK